VCKELLLDVSELEAPEPLTQIIDLLNTLEQHSYLRVIHRKGTNNGGILVKESPDILIICIYE